MSSQVQQKLDLLLRAGQKMSNVCFNLGQVVGQRAALEMRAAHREWDAARVDYQAAMLAVAVDRHARLARRKRRKRRVGGAE